MLALSTISLLLPAAAAVVGPSPRAMEMELQFQCEHDAEMATSRELIASGNAPLDLVMLTDAQGKDKGAVCLDGTNPGFYMTKGSGDGVDKWVLYFKGGGWCYDEASCVSRTKTSIGSATKFTKTFAFSGLMDSNASVNPTFANHNRVVLWYCDGASFSGDATAINHKTETPLYFRGKRVMDAMLDTLMSDHGLDTASEVLLSGGSAGGLAAYLHTDYVASKMPKTVKKYKSSPVSGFFLLHENAAGVPLYPNEMEYTFNMQNSTNGVNADCISSLATADQWRCIFANYSYAHTKSPIFPLNSAIDAWQMGNIWQGDSAGGCTHPGFKNCTGDETKGLNGYMSDFIRDMSTAPTWNKPGNGAFVESCYEHCGAQTGANFDRYTLKGVTMQAAHSKWWASEAGEDSAAAHTFMPGCELTAAGQCNPTCVA